MSTRVGETRDCQVSVRRFKSQVVDFISVPAIMCASSIAEGITLSVCLGTHPVSYGHHLSISYSRAARIGDIARMIGHIKENECEVLIAFPLLKIRLPTIYVLAAIERV